jgi:hypothetical protein
VPTRNIAHCGEHRTQVMATLRRHFARRPSIYGSQSGSKR